MSGLLRTLDGFWFVVGSSTRLAALRIIVGVAASIYLFPRAEYFTEIAGSAATVFEPAGVAALLSTPMPVQMFRILMTFTLIANVAFIVGWRFQRTGPLFAGLLLWVLCYRNSWSMVYHSDNLMLLQVMVLGLTRSADALSLDSLGGWLKQRGLRGRQPPEQPTSARVASASDSYRPRWHWEYGYPVMLILAVTALTYLLSGIAKVAGETGWGWALGEGLRSQVAFDGLRKELISDGASPLAFVLFNNLMLAGLLGVGTLVIELGAPLALLDLRLGRVWAVAAFAMHWGIWAIMGIVFWYHLMGFAFVPFLLDERMVAWALRTAERVTHALANRTWRRPTIRVARRRGVSPGPATTINAGAPIPDPG